MEVNHSLLLQKKSLARPGTSVYTVGPEENIRKGCQQFTTLSKVIAEWGAPRQYFMLVPKAVDNMYPLLLHIDGRNVPDIEANCPPAFKYSIVPSAMPDQYMGETYPDKLSVRAHCHFSSIRSFVKPSFPSHQSMTWRRDTGWSIVSITVAEDRA